VIGGDGSFSVPVEDPAAFSSAFMRKLLREIAGTGAALPIVASADPQAELDIR
jgi:hypothetical protein